MNAYLVTRQDNHFQLAIQAHTPDQAARQTAGFLAENQIPIQCEFLNNHTGFGCYLLNNRVKVIISPASY